jgi:hypothetical protein
MTTLQVLKAASIKMTVFGEAALCILAEDYRTDDGGSKNL